MGQMVPSVLSTSYGRDAGLESDKWGVRLMAMAGYDPRAMIDVMQILDEASGGAGGPPEISQHPPEAGESGGVHQAGDCRSIPNGVPDGLEK